MNFGVIIWGSAAAAVPDLMILFTIYFVLDLLRQFIWKQS